MPRPKRISSFIGQRKKYYSKRLRSQSMPDNCDSIISYSTQAEPHMDHDYLFPAARSLAMSIVLYQPKPQTPTNHARPWTVQNKLSLMSYFTSNCAC